MSDLRSAIYFGKVAHRRVQPVRLSFAYRVFMFLLDYDELAQLDRGGWLFGHNRPALFSFYDRDHGARDGSRLKDWAEAALTRAGITIDSLSIRILCFPRIAGYVFNPISLIFCYDRAEQLRAVLYEVKNTFGQQHTYLFPLADTTSAAPLSHGCPKEFYVSPFMDMIGDYRFKLSPPAEHFNLLICQSFTAGTQLIASWNGRRAAWSSSVLWHSFWRYPLLTLKVMAAIHWQALKLFWKKAPYHARPPLPDCDITIVTP